MLVAQPKSDEIPGGGVREARIRAATSPPPRRAEDELAPSTHYHKSLVRLIAEAEVTGRRVPKSVAVATVEARNAPGARDLRPFGRPKMQAGGVARSYR